MMTEVVRLHIAPNRHAFSVLASSVEAFGKLCGLSENRADKLVLAVEEIFTYCAKMLGKEPNKNLVEIGFLTESSFLQITIEYFGPVGELEHYFAPGSSGTLKRDSFEALGLYLAHQVVDKLVFSRTLTGKNQFALTLSAALSASVLRSLREASWE